MMAQKEVPMMASWGLPGGFLGAYLGASWGLLGGFLGASWGFLEKKVNNEGFLICSSVQGVYSITVL